MIYWTIDQYAKEKAKDNSKDYYFNTGFSTLGPLLFGFNCWLTKILKEDEIDIALFASREGQIFLNVYEGTIKCFYFYVSRNAIQKMLIWKYEEADDLLNNLKNNKVVLYLDSVIDLLGINVEGAQKIIELENASQNKVIDCSDKNNKEYLAFCKIYKQYWQDIFSESKRRYIKYVKYLKSLDVDHKRVGFIDIGWQGRMQLMIESFLKESDIDCKLFGYYMVLKDDTPLSKSNTRAYIRGNIHVKQDMFSSFSGLIEILCSANHGTVIDIDVQDNTIIPKVSDWENEDYKKEISAFQQGAKTFILGFKALIEREKISSSIVECARNMIKLGTHPSLEDVRKLSKLRFNNGSIYEVGIIKWKGSFRAFIKDFNLCGWKIAGLYNAIKLPINYYVLYVVLKRISKHLNMTGR